MPMPCTVCAHPQRGEIDARLAVQVVNVKQLALSYGLKRDAVARHRAKHLPAFLPALQARADALTLDQLNAEAQRLYLVALDALARAEAGTLAHVGDDGERTYAVSSTAVARLLREARSSLDLLAKLAVAAPSQPGGSDQPELTAGDPALDARIAAALDRAIARRDPPTIDAIADAEIVHEEAVRGALPAGDAGGDPRAPVDLVRPTAPRPRADEVPLDADEPVPSGSQGQSRDLVEEARDTARQRRDPISPAASAEEIHAMGYQIKDQPRSGPAVV